MSGIKVVVYSGQFDLIVDTVGKMCLITDAGSSWYVMEPLNKGHDGAPAFVERLSALQSQVQNVLGIGKMTFGTLKHVLFREVISIVSSSWRGGSER